MLACGSWLWPWNPTPALWWGEGRGKEGGILMRVIKLQVDLWKENRSLVNPGVWVQSQLKLGHCSECVYVCVSKREKLESTGVGHLNSGTLSLP